MTTVTAQTAGAILASMRRTKTKICPDCRIPFTGLVRKKRCDKCRNKHHQKLFREKRKREKEQAQAGLK